MKNKKTLLIAALLLGGVGGPVAAAGALPGDGDADVDAEHAGDVVVREVLERDQERSNNGNRGRQ